MLQEDKITILIQGPLNTTSLSNVDEYLKFGKVLISHWEQDEIKLLDSVKDKPNVKVVSQKMPERDEWESTWDGDKGVGSTFPWAWISTYFGLCEIDTELTIKTRSDEMFTNLQPIIDLHLQTEKIVWGNVWCRKWDLEPHIVGDHMFMDKTKRLKEAYETIYESNDLRYPRVCAEQILSIAYLRTIMGGESKEDAMNAYEFIDIDEFDDWFVRHGTIGREWNKKDYSGCLNVEYTPNGAKDTEEVFRKYV